MNEVSCYTFSHQGDQAGLRTAVLNWAQLQLEADAFEELGLEPPEALLRSVAAARSAAVEAGRRADEAELRKLRAEQEADLSREDRRAARELRMSALERRLDR